MIAYLTLHLLASEVRGRCLLDPPGRLVVPPKYRIRTGRFSAVVPDDRDVSSSGEKIFIGGGLYKAVTDVRRQVEMDEENQRLSSRKAVVATLLLGLIVLAGLAIFVLVLSQRACSGN